MRALVIAHEPDNEAGQIGKRLTERGFEVVTHLVTTDYARPNDAAPFPDTTGFDLIVPMGSVRSLTQKHEISNWIDAEMDIVRTAHERGIPILGVCFGHQIIADVLGGSVELSPTAEIGWVEIDDGDLSNPVGRGPWMQWHHDIIQPPPGSEVLARNAVGAQLIRIGKTVGTQFHPEVDVPHVQAFLNATPDDYLIEHGVSREQLLADTRLNEAANIKQCQALVDWFLDEVAFVDGPTDTPPPDLEHQS